MDGLAHIGKEQNNNADDKKGDERQQGSDPLDGNDYAVRYYPHSLPYQTAFGEFWAYYFYPCDLDGQEGWQVVIGEAGVVADAEEVKALLVGDAGVPAHGVHLVAAALEPEAEEHRAVRSHDEQRT